MPRARRPEITEAQLTGIKYLERVLPLLERLHPDGCQRDTAGNRQLFFDQYCALLLLFFFNPTIQSLRGLQRASELEKVQRKLSARRVSLGSLSEASRVFDAERLAEIVAELAETLPTPMPSGGLAGLSQIPTAVDGTLLKVLPQITQACYATRRDAGWRLHTHFEVLRGTVVAAQVTDARNSGPTNEKSMLRRMLQADRCYIADRGYEEFRLFNDIVAARSSYVCRVRNDHAFTVEQSRAIGEQAQTAGVIEDQIGRMGSPNSQRIVHPDHTMRRIVVRVPIHPKRRGKRPEVTHDLVLVTNLLDVPAEIIATLYRWRWLIELFFRFFKHVLGCTHLLSEDPGGLAIQVYCALIVCLLINVATGRKPNRATFEIVCLFFQGWATENELLAHLARLPQHDQP
jgi:hypothetical protein